MGVGIRQSLKDVQNMVSELADVEDIKKVVIKTLSSGVDPVDVVDAVSKGLEDVGERYEKGECFLSELIMAGIMASEIANILKSRLEKPLGKVVVGTVKGDLFDIGKNIVVAMLSAVGFRVVDLGIDVPSCLPTIAMDEMRIVINKLKEANLRETVKVMVGGRPITQDFANEIGADAYGSSAIEAVSIAKALIRAM